MHPESVHLIIDGGSDFGYGPNKLGGSRSGDQVSLGPQRRAGEAHNSPPAKSTQVLVGRPEQKMQSDVVSAHTIKSFHQPLEIEGQIQKDVILENAQPLIIRLHKCAPKKPMRVKATYFASGQFATFEAAGVGTQWQFADGVSL
jgi:hypothetical protein